MTKLKGIILAVVLIQLILLPVLIIASKQQQETRSQAAEPVSQEDQENLGNIGDENLSDFETTQNAPKEATNKTYVAVSTVSNPRLKKEVYGFLPYWEVRDNPDSHIQYELLTTLSYFGIGLKPDGTIKKDSGPYNTWKSQELKKVLTNARSKGVKIHPSIVLFNGKGEDRIGKFLSSPELRTKGIKNIIEELKTSEVPVDGVNIDFETPGSKDRANFLLFIKELDKELEKANPDWTLVVCTFGSTAKAFGGFDLPELSKHVDGFFIMSYHLVSPRKATNAKSKNPYKRLETIVNQYKKFVPSEKIILGFPLYTSEWITKDESFHSQKISGGGQILHQEALLKYKYYGGGYDETDKSAWFAYKDCKTGTPQWRQVYFDDERAQIDKFGLANTKDIGGIGLWALNQDKGHMELWNAIYFLFADKDNTNFPQVKSGSFKAEYKEDPNCQTEKKPLPSRADVNKDLKLDILDWNILKACSTFQSVKDEKICPNESPFLSSSDFDRNAKVNEDDFTFWLKEFID